jgi:hypothetical protein
LKECESLKEKAEICSMISAASKRTFASAPGCLPLQTFPLQYKFVTLATTPQEFDKRTARFYSEVESVDPWHTYYIARCFPAVAAVAARHRASAASPDRKPCPDNVMLVPAAKVGGVL